MPGWTTWTKTATRHLLLGLAPGGGPSEPHLSQGNHEPFLLCLSSLGYTSGPSPRTYLSWVTLLGHKAPDNGAPRITGTCKPLPERKGGSAEPAQRRVKKCHDIKMLIGLLGSSCQATQKRFSFPRQTCLRSQCAQPDSDGNSCKAPVAVFLRSTFYFKQTTAVLGCMLVRTGCQEKRHFISLFPPSPKKRSIWGFF